MVKDSKIQWTDHTFNPWVGCEKISPACDHCYAEVWAKRAGNPQLWSGERRRTSASNWAQPLKWNREAAAAGRRARVFCASLADVFDNQIPFEWRRDLIDLISRTPHLDWLLLTKRIGNAREMLNDAVASLTEGDRANHPHSWDAMSLPNVWLGATIANQAEAERDIPKLLATTARLRFLSIEPMLGPIDIRRFLVGHEDAGTPFDGARTVGGCRAYTPPIDWVIVGGESGGHAREFSLNWARGLIDQCDWGDIPIFVKQLGRFPTCNGLRLELKDPKGGDIEEFPAGFRFRQFPHNEHT